MNGYELSRNWFDWCFENPEKIKPNHTALYFFAVEHCNRLGWKKKYGMPTTMAMEAIGIKSYNTYINTLNDLVEWGFIEMIQRSKNQYSANIVALSNFDKALDKALDEALIKHASKQSESIDSIDKQETSKQINNEQKPPSLEEVISYFDENGYTKESATKMFEYYEESRKPSGRVWKDGRGNTVKNWKQKARSIWFKDDNLKKNQEYDFKNFENVEYP
jgi:hypothetical protein